MCKQLIQRQVYMQTHKHAQYTGTSSHTYTQTQVYTTWPASDFSALSFMSKVLSGCREPRMDILEAPGGSDTRKRRRGFATGQGCLTSWAPTLITSTHPSLRTCHTQPQFLAPGPFLGTMHQPCTVREPSMQCEGGGQDSRGLCQASRAFRLHDSLGQGLQSQAG